MKERKLNELSLIELEEKEKTFRRLLYAFVGVITFLIGVIIYSIIERGITGLVVLPIVFFPLLFILTNNLNNIKSEIESKKSIN